MFYSLQLMRHPNVHYRDAVRRLSRCELLCMLRKLSIETELLDEEMGGASFLTFESRKLSPKELSWLSRHSSVVFLSEKHDGMLLPLAVPSDNYLSDDLPEILKYKGKTSASFTRMMVNTALALTPFHDSDYPLTVLDPLCGRGTTLFCALCAGANAVGIDTDPKALKEAGDYFSRYLRQSRIKHSQVSGSETADRKPVPRKTFVFAPDKVLFRTGDTRSLTLLEGDSGLAGSLLSRSRAHLIVSDLPYGVQHAPQAGSRPESFMHFLARILPAWKQALIPGAAIALSFNTLTLKSDDVRRAVSASGFTLMDSSVFSDLSHTVDQAVVRDLVFAVVS